MLPQQDAPSRVTNVQQVQAASAHQIPLDSPSPVEHASRPADKQEIVAFPKSVE
jgi:hypothetical protein